MKKIFSLMLALMAIALPAVAQDSDGNSSSTPIAMETHPFCNHQNPPVLRTPMRICVEAYYDAVSSTISIIYCGEATGEAFLYRDGELMASASEINTTFKVTGQGYYTIEILAESWTATGNVEI